MWPLVNVWNEWSGNEQRLFQGSRPYVTIANISSWLVRQGATSLSSPQNFDSSGREVDDSLWAEKMIYPLIVSECVFLSTEWHDRIWPHDTSCLLALFHVAKWQAYSVGHHITAPVFPLYPVNHLIFYSRDYSKDKKKRKEKIKPTPT